MEDLPTAFYLSSAQLDTARLLNNLLGQAVAARYEDFCRLAAGEFGLNVSVPIAAHALRELESMLRTILKVPMDVVANEDPNHRKKTREARKLLTGLKFDQEAINRAINDLDPRISHKNQISRIVGRLGLDPRGDIATLWIRLTSTNEMVHNRSFHRSLKVDDSFRSTYQEPFDIVIRAVAIALQSRYAALTRYVEALASSTNYARAVKSFKDDIPNATQLQRHFYSRLATGAWLPHLMKAGLLGEPVAWTSEVAGEGQPYGEWPAGSYLLRMAGSTTANTHKGVVAALRSVSGSKHPRVRQTGLAILAALPVNESAPLTDLAVSWINSADGPSYLSEPDQLVRKLADNGESTAALCVSHELLRLWEDNGQIASHHAEHMYQHYLPTLTASLTAACGIEALHLIVALLRQAVTISSSARYGYLSTRSISESEMPPNDIFEALVNAVRDSAELLLATKIASTSHVVSLLARESDGIFTRLCLYLLARQPSSARRLASSFLLNEALIGTTWSQAEYDALANAWFPSLTSKQKSKILQFVGAMPDKYHTSWQKSFETSNNRPPSFDEEQSYRASVIAEVLWGWRSVLPPDLRDTVEKSGDPYPWRLPTLGSDDGPIEAPDFATAGVAQIVTFLKEWQPGPEPHRQTVTALSQQLHSAAVGDPRKYSTAAHHFMCLKPVYIRQLLDGLQYASNNKNQVDWGSILRLITFVVTKGSESREGIDPKILADGDDEVWHRAVKSAAKMLLTGLRLGIDGIPAEHAGTVRRLVLAVLSFNSQDIDIEDFDNRFERHPFFTAQDTSDGIATELCLLLHWWMQLGVMPAQRGRATIAGDPEIARSLARQLEDRTTTGRIPRAIVGRYLRLMYYTDEIWLRSHMAVLFPAEDEALRKATWSSHLMNDRGPVGDLLPDLAVCYLEEIGRLSQPIATMNDSDRKIRERRFASYVMVLVLDGSVTEHLLQQFLLRAPSSVRRGAMWFVGDEVSKPLSMEHNEVRQRGIGYWDQRLAAATGAPDRDQYREELGAISRWCFHGAVDEIWLCDQVLAMTDIGVAPSDWYGTAEWLQKVASRHADRAVELLLALVRVSAPERWVYSASQEAIRFILTEGLEKGTLETAARVSGIINHLASLGETDFINLDPPTLNP